MEMWATGSARGLSEGDVVPQLQMLPPTAANRWTSKLSEWESWQAGTREVLPLMSHQANVGLTCQAKQEVVETEYHLIGFRT